MVNVKIKVYGENHEVYAIKRKWFNVKEYDDIDEKVDTLVALVVSESGHNQRHMTATVEVKTSTVAEA